MSIVKSFPFDEVEVRLRGGIKFFVDDLLDLVIWIWEIFSVDLVVFKIEIETLAFT